jgi:hypothetical protein
MAETIQHVPDQARKYTAQTQPKDLPGEDRSELELVLRGGGGFSKWTRNLQIAGGIVALPFSAGASAFLFSGAILDNEMRVQGDQYADGVAASRKNLTEATYGPGKVKIKGKVVDRNAVAYEPTAKSESVSAKMAELFGKTKKREIVNVKALEAQKAA